MNEWVAVDGEPGLKGRFGPDGRTGRLIVTGLLLDGPAVTAQLLRQIPIGRIEAAANGGAGGESPDDLPPLVRPRRALPDASAEFLRLVARHYHAWSRRSPTPAARMAEAAGIKSPTMHTWIREARLEGHLPLRPRGKAAGVDLSEGDED
jgi:hypothetical protein